MDGRSGAIEYPDAGFLSGQSGLSYRWHRIFGADLCGEIIAVSIPVLAQQIGRNLME